MPVHPKYTNVDPNHPEAVAQCDYSGLIGMHRNLVKQMEYSGKGLYWTGYWVLENFADLPNPQKMTYQVKMDPVPVRYPRPSPFLTEPT